MRSKPIEKSEPFTQRKPEHESEPWLERKPSRKSEPIMERKPSRKSAIKGAYMEKRNEEKFLPGSDYNKIRGLADLLNDDYTAWGNGLIIPAWGKRFTFDDLTGDIIKVQELANSAREYRDLGIADDIISYALPHFAAIINRWAHKSGTDHTDAGTYAYQEAMEEIEKISSEPFSIPSRLMFICAVHGLRTA